MRRRKFLGSRRQRRVVLAISSLLYLTSLLGLISAEVFVSGDASIKYLWVQGFVSSPDQLSLQLGAPDWVRASWRDHGSFPIGAPFAYVVDGQNYLAFPLPFLILTALPYLLLGFFGLYAIPVIGVALTVHALATVMDRQEVSRGGWIIGAISLVLASPLLVYGATFWEHSIAVALASWGTIWAISPKKEDATHGALIAGVLLGAAGWIRPECMIYGVLVVAAVASLRRFRYAALSAAALLIIGAAFAVWNLAVYGTLTGAHGMQISLSAADRIFQGLSIGLRTTILSFVYIPSLTLVLLVLCLSNVPHVKKSFASLSKESKAISFLAFAYLVIVPFFLPNSGGLQWGPRYLLLLAPLTAWAAARLLSESNILESATGIAACTAIVVAGVALNTVGGFLLLQDVYAQRLQRLEVLEGPERHTVIVSNAWASQTFFHYLRQHNFFVIPSFSILSPVDRQMQAHSVDQFVYIFFNPTWIRSPGENLMNTPPAGWRCDVIGPLGREYHVHHCVRARARG